MARKPLTLDEVKDALSKVNGSRTNPHNGESCLYNDPDNPDRHCIVGQILCDLGMKTAVKRLGQSVMSVNALWSKPGFARLRDADKEAQDFLLDVQNEADGATFEGVIPLRWAEVKKAFL